MSPLPAIECFESDTKITIYRLPVEVFPDFIGYSYLVLGAGVPTLIDTGSGFFHSNEDLLAALDAIRDDFGEAFQPSDIERIIISHGHVDHFGGLATIKEAVGGAQVGIHPLDRRVLTNYEERVVVATKDLGIYLWRAGVREEKHAHLMEMYGFSKKHVRSVDVDFTFEDGDTLDGMTFYHVPGHCSGQVAIQIGDILLTADHILPRTSPHVAAESITHYTGLGHYRDSLRHIRRVDGIRLAMGGHEAPIENLHERIDNLQQRIDHKLERLLRTIRNADEPISTVEVSKRMYPDKHGFDVLLALQEAGAYVEYLYHRGYLAIANLEEYDADDNPALLYTLT